MTVLFFTVLSVIMILIDFGTAVLSFRQKDIQKKGLCLGLSSLFAGGVSLSYLGCVFSQHVVFYSIFSSLYFIQIDYLLICMIMFTSSLTHRKRKPWQRGVLISCGVLGAVETLYFVFNIFQDVVISYLPTESHFGKFTYERHALYNLHLVYTYLMVVLVLGLLIYKMYRTPKQYRRPYLFILIGIVVVVLINASYLFVQHKPDKPILDYSLLAYGIVVAVMYWSVFIYQKDGMLNSFKQMIYDTIDQGLVLFTYEDEMLLHNEKSEELLNSIDFGRADQITLPEFLKRCGLDERSVNTLDSCTLICTIRQKDHRKKRRICCDYRSVRNKKGVLLGRLFVFTDIQLESDLVTGFRSWEYFKKDLMQSKGILLQPPVTVLVVDLNDLNLVNMTYGREEGDRRMSALADAMREYLPVGSLFVHDADACMVALSPNTTEQQMEQHLKKIREEIPYPFQYGLKRMEGEETELEAIETAKDGMMARKLMDKGSKRSEFLTSLSRTLQEVDTDTEAHVERTKELGQALGRRIGLSDSQQSSLALLCLVHDIGKIGIPLEILNKPTKLTPEEWEVIKSHTSKGYEIARSSQELRGIADCILHHHERWDGQGYPDGLSRESIPLLARIIAVVDSYDAMVNHRSYWKALTKEQAIEELKRCAGSQFDPYLVSNFLEVLQDDELQFEVNHPSAAAPKNEPEENAVMEGRLMSARSIEHAELPTFSVIPFTRYTVDMDMRIVDTDDYFEKLTGFTKDEIRVLGLHHYDLIPEDDRTEYMLRTTEEIAQHHSAFLEHRLRRKDGQILDVFCYGKQYYDAASHQYLSEIIVFDSRESIWSQDLARKEQERARNLVKQYEDAYRHDSLTDLLNHSAFQNDVEEHLLSGQNRVALMMIDVDFFKQYNDTYGHRAGDEYLVQIAHSLSAALGDTDLASRMGGDEFAAAVFFAPDASAEVMTERVQEIFEGIRYRIHHRAPHPGTFSIGVSFSGGENQTFNRLYEAADRALYVSKEHGKNQLNIDQQQ